MGRPRHWKLFSEWCICWHFLCDTLQSLKVSKRHRTLMPEEVSIWRRINSWTHFCGMLLVRIQLRNRHGLTPTSHLCSWKVAHSGMKTVGEQFALTLWEPVSFNIWWSEVEEIYILLRSHIRAALLLHVLTNILWIGPNCLAQESISWNLNRMRLFLKWICRTWLPKGLEQILMIIICCRFFDQSIIAW